jgi:hypothetical protein
MVACGSCGGNTSMPPATSNTCQLQIMPLNVFLQGSVMAKYFLLQLNGHKQG